MGLLEVLPNPTQERSAWRQFVANRVVPTEPGVFRPAQLIVGARTVSRPGAAPYIYVPHCSMTLRALQCTREKRDRLRAIPECPAVNVLRRLPPVCRESLFDTRQEAALLHEYGLVGHDGNGCLLWLPVASEALVVLEDDDFNSGYFEHANGYRVGAAHFCRQQGIDSAGDVLALFERHGSPVLCPTGQEIVVEGCGVRQQSFDIFTQFRLPARFRVTATRRYETLAV